MQRNQQSSEENAGKADRVFQTNPTNNEREEVEKMDTSCDDNEFDPIVTKEPTIEPFKLTMNNVKLKETHKIKLGELVLDLIL